MPAIEIHREHHKSAEEARAAVERVADKISDRFDVEYGWEGNTMHFKRSGVDGHIAVAEGEVHVIVNLGFLLTALRGPIEAQIHQAIDREFA